MNPAALGALMRGDVKNAIVAATPGGIERQVAEGQQAFVMSSTLPLEYNFCTREDIEKLGIVFGKVVDDLFVEVTLPEGWSLHPMLHTMWSELHDQKQRVRATIFYDAAFYDRKAYISLVRYFNIRTGDTYPPAVTQVVVMNGDGEMVFITKPFSHDNCEDQESAEHMCEEWLGLHYPEWKKFHTYWT